MNSFNNQKNIICFANDWKEDPTSKHQVMKILSKDHKILWVNSIAMRAPTVSKADISRIFNKIKLFSKGVEQINNNLYVFTPLVLPFPKYSFVRWINFLILIVSLKYYITKLRLHPFQLWSFLPTMANLIGRLGEQTVVYYCVDEWSKFSFLDGKLMRQMELDVLKKSNTVITTAKTLFEDKRKYNKNTHLIPHGVDFDHFNKARSPQTMVPEEMMSIPAPIIGFFGLIHDWIDLDLIEFLALKKPTWSIVLIGNSSVDISQFKSYPNIHVLGKKNYADLPGYCKAMNAAIIPFRINDLTIHVNPIKLREYLSAGLPVVSTPLPEVEQYEKIVSIGRDSCEFLEKLETELRDDSEEKRNNRIDAMKKETWESKVEQIIKTLG